MFNYYKYRIRENQRVKVNKDYSEIIAYDEVGVPIFIQECFLSDYHGYRALCHWHEDMEFISVTEGQMDYYIDGETVPLEAGDSVMVNSGRLHYGYSVKKEECRYYCVIFHPAMLTANKILYQKYVEPVISNRSMNYLLFPSDQEMAGLLKQIYERKQTHPQDYEMEALGQFHTLWDRIRKEYREGGNMTDVEMDEERYAQKRMVSYIFQNYADPLTLDEIARSGNLSRSKCCRVFKKYVRQSPMEFVNAYRLECSERLLATTDLEVTEIGISCGFNHLSYFSKLFREKYGCTPRNYRNKHKLSGIR